jgi:tetratricopeptide (TPR) repeat protein
MISIPAATARARYLSHHGHHDAAIEIWRDILSEEPTLAHAHAGLAQSLFGARRITAADAEAREALRLDPEAVDAMLVLSLTAYFEGRTALALDRIDGLLEVDPLAVGAMTLKAQILRIDGKLDEAGAAIEAALAIAPDSLDALVERGWLARDRRDRQTVARIAGDLIARDPGYQPAFVLLGYARRDAGDHQAALDLALQALAIDPMDREALNLIVSVKLAANPVGGLFWHLVRYLTTMRESRRLVTIGLIYFLYLATLTTFDRLGLPEALSWLFVAVYLGLGIGLYLNEQLIRWLVDRERRQVALRAGY